MSPLFRKLNLGTQSVIHVLNAPASFDAELARLSGVKIRKSVTGAVQFALAFVVTEAQLAAASTKLAEGSDGDAVLWMIYPKASSKKYRCEFNRDSGWPALGAAGFEPVRMVAVDEDWSALRFRRAQYIAKLRRNPASAISRAGRRKASETVREKR